MDCEIRNLEFEYDKFKVLILYEKLRYHCFVYDKNTTKPIIELISYDLETIAVVLENGLGIETPICY